ncbi:hypothetical protein [Methanogenium organophilum]|uniref:Uncharacterized protein n=1 Tax=Methanogenium organophilum TaxID=2199 RepID=A0A9X9T844_METOG|nr:hypothetical protein [Methanogenium organophilum]WAI01345.1 hypothetical protein OU421_00260 [Methanogenium organophilum]
MTVPPYTTTANGEVEKNPGSGESYDKPPSFGYEKSILNGLNQDPESLRYGDHPFQTSYAPEFNIKEQCKLCPFKYSKFERDAIQYVVIDPVFRNLLELLATPNKWKIKRKKRDTWIYLDHVTFQLGNDFVVIYSDDPYDLKWIGNWVRENLQGYYVDIEKLVSKIVHPRLISRDELSIDITDPEMIQTVEGLTENYKNKSGYLRFNSPNEVIPALKIYRKDKVLRMEFICHSGFQTTSVIAIRNRLLYCLQNICKQPGCLYDFLHSYYPTDINSDIKCSIQKIETGLDELKQMVKLCSPEPVIAKGKIGTEAKNKEKINAVIDSIDKENVSMDSISCRISEIFGVTREAAIVFLAGFQIWATSIYRKRVMFEDISSLFLKQSLHNISKLSCIRSAARELIAAGLLNDDPELDISFSSQGTTLGKKLIAKKEGIK